MRNILGRFFEARSGVTAIAQTAIASLTIQALNLASGILIARVMGPNGRGALSATIMWPQFLASGLSAGIPIASLHWLKRRPQASSSLVGAALLLSLILGIVASGMGFLIIPYSLHTYPAAEIQFARRSVLITPLAMLAVTIVYLVRAAGAFRELNIFRCISPLSVVAVLFFETAEHRLTFSNAALAYLLAGTPVTIWIASWVWRHFTPTLNNFLGSSKLLLSYGVRAWGGEVMSTIANQVDRVFIVAMIDPHAMGLYVVAQSAVGILAILPGAVVPVLQPKSTGHVTEDISDLTGQAARMTFFLMCLGSLPLWFFGAPLINVVYGVKFTASAALLPFLLVEAILDGVTSVLAQAFLASGAPGAVTLLQGSGLLASVPLLYWLTPRFGGRGAACALMIATIIRFLLMLLSFRIRLAVSPPRMMIRREELLMLLMRIRELSSRT